MAIFEVLSWVVSRGKRKENDDLMRRYSEYIKSNPDKFKEQKSFRYFSGWFGKPSGATTRICMFEFGSLEDMEKMYDRLNREEEFVKIDKEWGNLVEVDSYEHHIWQDKDRSIWIE